MDRQDGGTAEPPRARRVSRRRRSHARSQTDGVGPRGTRTLCCHAHKPCTSNDPNSSSSGMSSLVVGAMAERVKPYRGLACEPQVSSPSAHCHGCGCMLHRLSTAKMEETVLW